MQKLQTKDITITPYTYWGINSGFKDKIVWVIKGDESPDPAHRMMWGRTAEGAFPGDYKRSFTKAGKPIIISYSTEGLWTAMDERKAMLKAVDEFIKGVEAI